MSQLEFDWTHAERLNAIQTLQLQRLSGVSMNAVRRVLEKLYLFAGPRGICPGIDELASRACVSRRVAIRALTALETASLICVDRQHRWGTNRYRIVWSELAVLANLRVSKCQDGTLAPAFQSATPAFQSADMAPKEKRRKKKEEETPGLLLLLEMLPGAGAVYAKAISRGLSDAAVLERAEAWKRLPKCDQVTGKLVHWLTESGCYARHMDTTVQPRASKVNPGFKTATAWHELPYSVKYELCVVWNVGKNKYVPDQVIQKRILEIEQELLSSLVCQGPS